MGVQSPLIAPCATPLKKLSSASAEFPPLGALKGTAGESQVLGENQAHDLFRPSSSAETNSGDEHDHFSDSSTGLACDNESLELRSNGSTSKTSAEVEVFHDTGVAQIKDSVAKQITLASPEELLQAKGVMKVDAASLVPAADHMPTEAYLLQFLCRIFNDKGSGMRIEPCTGDNLYADDEHQVFWCYMQQQLDGAVMITPCGDAAVCGIAFDANRAPLLSTEDVVGAPIRSSQGSYAPAWVYGAQWPFCVAPTTLILSNLPKDLQQEDLIEIIDKEGFSGFYDFLHMPMDLDLSSNLGYATVNLTRHEYGLALSALMHGRSSWCGANTLACQVTWDTHSQGLTQLIEHYQGHPACGDKVPLDMRPTWFSSGWPHPLPLEKQT